MLKAKRMPLAHERLPQRFTVGKTSGVHLDPDGSDSIERVERGLFNDAITAVDNHRSFLSVTLGFNAASLKRS